MSEANKLFVGNLSANLDEADLHTFFEHFGEIIDLKIMVNQDAGGVNFAFVTFATYDSTTDALSMHGVELDNKVLRVSMASNAEVRFIKQDSSSKLVLAENMLKKGFPAYLVAKTLHMEELSSQE